MSLLLVSCSPDWTQAVNQAAQELGGLAVSPCEARDALARLASSERAYSHVLVERDCAEGLLDVFVKLVAETTNGADMAMLMLGAPAATQPAIGVIPSATRCCVREALTRPAFIRIGERSLAADDLLGALAGPSIEARYQPIVRIADRRVVALEALARLNHPEYGTLLPDRFVPQLEDAGLAADLTALISARAFTDLTTSLADYQLGITLNFPLDVLLRGDALSRLEAQRCAASVPADRVMIELTESRPVEDFVALGRSIEHLRALGYRVAIDDIDMSVPGLDQLLALPFTGVKLDKDLVRASIGDVASADFLVRTAARVKALGMTVVAEGVESEAIWARMAELGADAAQGFLVARPLPAAAVPIWLEIWQSPAQRGQAASCLDDAHTSGG